VDLPARVEQARDFFLKFLRVERIFDDGVAGWGSGSAMGEGLFRDRCRGRHRRMLVGLVGCRPWNQLRR